MSSDSCPVNFFDIALYCVSEPDFFTTPYCINCQIAKFCAFNGADYVFDIDSVLRQKLVRVDEGIEISEPVPFEKISGEGFGFFISLSHNGVLAIYHHALDNVIQFVDLINDKNVEVSVECPSQVGFYDDKMILLTYYKPLRETRVADIFVTPSVDIFKNINEIHTVDLRTDVSLIHSTRTLYYTTTGNLPFKFNVDTREVTPLDIDHKVSSFASMLGIDIGLKGIFSSHSDNRAYLYCNDGSRELVSPEQHKHTLITVFATEKAEAAIAAKDMQEVSKNIVLKYRNFLIRDTHKLNVQSPITIDDFYSIVRVYRDIFLTYDGATRKWVLVRIVIS